MKSSSYCHSCRTWNLILLQVLIFLPVILIESQIEAFDTYKDDSIQALATGLEESPSIETYVAMGDEAFLPCNITPPVENDSPLLVIFFKGAQPIYSLDARDKNILHSIHWSAPHLDSRRPSFVVASSPHGLVLPSVEPDDESVYHCRVDFVASPTRNLNVKLHVSVPPSKIRIQDAFGQTINSKVGPFTIGKTPTLRCVVFGGRPNPRITWWFNGSKLDGVVTGKNLGEKHLENENSLSTVTLPQLTREDLNREITCEAQSSNITKPIAVSVRIDMIFPPNEVKIQKPSKPFTENGLFKLLCVSEGSKPPSNITWWKDGILIKSYKNKLSGNKTVSTIFITPTRADHNLIMSCRAENVMLPKSILEDTLRLNVQYPPVMTLRPGSSLNIHEIKEGDDVYFECDVVANPQVSFINWFLNNNPLAHNVSAGVIVSGQSLVIQRIKRIFSGKYRCEAENILDSAVSNSVLLKVKYSPECKSHEQVTFGGARGEYVNISCELIGEPLPNKFVWAFNATSDMALLNHEERRNKPGRSILFYHLKNNSDFGPLLCWGENSVAKQREPCMFQVVPASPPERVKNCSVIVNPPSSEEVIVSCIPGWNGGLPQKFKLEVRQSHSEKVLSTVSNEKFPTFQVRGLKAGTEFVLSILAENSRGLSAPIQMSHFAPIDIAEERLSAATESSGDPKDFVVAAYLIAIFIGIFVVLGIIAIVAFLVLRSRNASSSSANQSGSNAMGDTTSPAAIDNSADNESFDSQGPDIILISTNESSDRKKVKICSKTNRVSKFVSEEQLLSEADEDPPDSANSSSPKGTKLLAVKFSSAVPTSYICATPPLLSPTGYSEDTSSFHSPGFFSSPPLPTHHLSSLSSPPPTSPYTTTFSPHFNSGAFNPFASPVLSKGELRGETSNFTHRQMHGNALQRAPDNADEGGNGKRSPICSGAGLGTAFLKPLSEDLRRGSSPSGTSAGSASGGEENHPQESFIRGKHILRKDTQGQADEAKQRESFV